MSSLEGKFKAKVIYPEVSQAGAAKPYLQVLFGLKEQYVNDDWVTLEDSAAGIATQTYWLSKVNTNPDAKMTPNEYSRMRFKKDFGFEIDKYPNLEELREALRDVEKVLILEEDDSSFHKIKYVNSLGGKVKEGMEDLLNVL